MLERSLGVVADPPAEVDAIVRVIHGRLVGSSRVRHMPGIPARALHEAVARYGSGLDYAGGEVPIALVGNGWASLRGYRAGYVVTDRRVFGRVEGANNMPSTFTDVPFARVVGVPRKARGFTQSTVIHLSDGSHGLYLLPKQWHAFFAEMVATIAPENRTLGPVPPVPLAAEDPTGALAASDVVRTADTRTWVPLRALYEAQRRNMIDVGEAAGFVPDMAMLARGVATGRGAAWSGWHSVLPRQVLVHALQTMLGAPSAVHQAEGDEVFDFPAGRRRSYATGTAVVRGTAGPTPRVMRGIGCISISDLEWLTGIRVRIADRGSDTAFRLFGTAGAAWEPLSVRWWHSVDAIHQALFRMEARYLLGRALFGAGRPFDDLLALPRDELETVTAELLGAVNLAVFYPA